MKYDHHKDGYATGKINFTKSGTDMCIFHEHLFFINQYHLRSGTHYRDPQQTRGLSAGIFLLFYYPELMMNLFKIPEGLKSDNSGITEVWNLQIRIRRVIF
jgi:hypothetical protein